MAVARADHGSLGDELPTPLPHAVATSGNPCGSTRGAGERYGPRSSYDLLIVDLDDARPSLRRKSIKDFFAALALSLARTRTTVWCPFGASTSTSCTSRSSGWFKIGACLLGTLPGPGPPRLMIKSLLDGPVAARGDRSQPPQDQDQIRRCGWSVGTRH
jgi:hypothetical protein